MKITNSIATLCIEVLTGPGFVELGVCLLFTLTFPHWLPEWTPRPLDVNVLILVVAFTIAYWLAAVRHRFDPLFHWFFAVPACLLTVFLVLWLVELVGSNSLTDHGFAIVRMRKAALWYLFMLLALMPCSMLISVMTGIRRRHQYVPGLMRALKARDKRIRRRAARAINRIAQIDRGINTKSSLNQLRRRLLRGRTHPAACDAVSGLLEALEDDDPVVRIEAAKALKQIGGTEKEPEKEEPEKGDKPEKGASA